MENALVIGAISLIIQPIVFLLGYVCGERKSKDTHVDRQSENLCNSKSTKTNDLDAEYERAKKRFFQFRN